MYWFTDINNKRKNSSEEENKIYKKNISLAVSEADQMGRKVAIAEKISPKVNSNTSFYQENNESPYMVWTTV